MRRPKTIPEIEQALVLREAGHTLSGISEQLNISPSTLKRHFKTHGVKRGTLKADAVAEARQRLLDDVTLVDQLKVAMASAVQDDLSVAKQLRESLVVTIEQLNNDPSLNAVFKGRALAALSTSAKVTSDIIRRALKMDQDLIVQEDLPSLHICKMSDEEIAEIQASHAKDDFFDDEPESVTGDLVANE